MALRWNDLSHIPLYEPGKPIDGLEDVIKLASNENPYGPSPKVTEAILAALGEVYLYPDGAGRALKQTLSEYYGFPPEFFILGAGADELISMLPVLTLGPGREAIMAEITFPMYRIATLLAGGRVRTVSMTDHYDLDLSAHLTAIHEKTGLMYIANPNNPTGKIVDREALLSFLKRVPDDLIVVLDEAYAEYVTDEAYASALTFLPDFPNLIVLRTFSKAYGLAGLRIGYGIAHPELITALERTRKPFNTSRLAQQAAIAALGDQAYVARVIQATVNERTRVYQTIVEEGWDVLPSETNFLFLPHADPRTLAYTLEEKGIIVRPLAGGLRVTIGTPEQNDRLLQAVSTLS
ncbi:MAG: Biosynthetic Aromatic amino acid aminotransferase beta [Candidatus Carbobacillus altaicus]|uniref:Histidinol-phosphate aminotransferase n=1 Tax=Candidatus Carbonibacillus altaicus TaxID=2163959 RepID=A0A2R6Y1S9_9BACL|nr:MAG: Biosynthetic Aromatic amino acid aminotransferase beta [Candidatus Carbobacillus altaicus]